MIVIGLDSIFSKLNKQYGESSKKLKIDLPYDLVILLLGNYQKEKKLFIKVNAALCSLQHYSQLPRYGSNLS